MNLINRIHDINSGDILIENIPKRDLDRDSLRNNISVVTQQPYIFNYSVKDNLLIAKPGAKMSEIREACRLAHIDDYIMSLPKKYNTILGEGGVILSGGQKQRLAIARALLMKTKIILFDSDRIFVIEEGKLVDSGTHYELLNGCPLYRSLYDKDSKK